MSVRVWRKYKSKKTITHHELIKIMTEKGKGIILIEGKSGCGKTSIIKSIARNVERVSDYRVLATKDGFKVRTSFPVFCLDNADLMGGMVQTQYYIAKHLNELSKTKTVIVSGIELKKRIPHLFDGLEKFDYYRFAGEQ